MKIEDVLKNIQNRDQIIDFTGLSESKNQFKKFSADSYELISSFPQNSKILIIDWAHSLKPSELSEINFVKDHINLTTQNPSLGRPHFYAVNSFYQQFNDLKNESIVVGLNPQAVPSKAEVLALVKAGATHYSYNLVQTALCAAERGLTGIGILINRDS